MEKIKLFSIVGYFLWKAIVIRSANPKHSYMGNAASSH
jgi:hypothetical protein